MMCVLSIDPGLDGTGLAWWRWEGWKEPEGPFNCENLYGATREPEIGNWLVRGQVIASKLRVRISTPNLKVMHIYCEYPKFMDNASGHMVARKGDLLKLTTLVGVFAEMAWERRIPFTLVPVNDWMGQLPFEVMQRRLIDRIPDVVKLNPKSHSWSAIGIGLHSKGFFKCPKSKGLKAESMHEFSEN